MDNGENSFRPTRGRGICPQEIPYQICPQETLHIDDHETITELPSSQVSQKMSA